MFIICIDYKEYAVPDEKAVALFDILGVIKPVKSDRYSHNRKFEYDDDPIKIEVMKVADNDIKPIEEEKPEKKKSIDVTPF